MQPDLNCLSTWFPPLLQAELPVPKTSWFRMKVELNKLLDGETPEGFDDFEERIRDIANLIGFPLFLRSGQTSGKHEWEKTCHVPDADSLIAHVAAIVEYSNLVDIMGLPTDVWAVRELLPTDAAFHVYRGMPVTREFRCFVDGGGLVCCHPYWPKGALMRGFPHVKTAAGKPGVIDLSALREEPARELPDDFDWKYTCLCNLPGVDTADVHLLASKAGLALSGDLGHQQWSVDILETRRGWYITDCAVAAQSFHWEGCPNAAWFVGELR